MTKNIAELYIAEVAELYNISEKNIHKMREGADKINAALGDYYWDDVRHALQVFYTRHSDKSRPRLAQVLALLESNRDVQKRGPDVSSTPNLYARPTTKIWSIQADFDRMIDILVEGGVIPDTDGTFRNTRSIIDPATDLPVLNPIQWLVWKLCVVEQARPDLFSRFPHANRLERLAIALGNHLITFKVRNWAKHAAELRARNDGVMPRGDASVAMGGM